MMEKSGNSNSDLINQWGALAEALEYRYLSERAILGDVRNKKYAAELSHKARLKDSRVFLGIQPLL